MDGTVTFYNVQLDANAEGDTTVEGLSEKINGYYVETAELILPELTREGYTFKGWASCRGAPPPPLTPRRLSPVPSLPPSAPGSTPERARAARPSPTFRGTGRRITLSVPPNWAGFGALETAPSAPGAYITRAQAMTMINRVLNRIPEDADDLRKDMNVWPDCNPGDWFCLAVQEATNSHDYKHKAGSCETWTGMNGDRDWSRYEN